MGEDALEAALDSDDQAGQLIEFILANEKVAAAAAAGDAAQGPGGGQKRKKGRERWGTAEAKKKSRWAIVVSDAEEKQRIEMIKLLLTIGDTQPPCRPPACSQPPSARGWLF